MIGLSEGKGDTKKQKVWRVASGFMASTVMYNLGEMVFLCLPFLSVKVHNICNNVRLKRSAGLPWGWYEDVQEWPTPKCCLRSPEEFVLEFSPLIMVKLVGEPKARYEIVVDLLSG